MLPGMSWKDAIKDPAEKEVFRAMDGPDITWRTVSAISRQTGISEQQIAEILLRYSSTFTRIYDGPTITGKPLVGLIEKVG